MGTTRPTNRPALSRERAVDVAAAAWALKHPGKALPSVFVLAVRGYFRDTMGKPGTNDYGINDDGLIVVAPGSFFTFNGNTDPSRIGWNPNANKYMARLKPGIYMFTSLYHKKGRPTGHPAFGQGNNPVTVERIRQDGSIAVTETGLFGINLHRGGDPNTSSEGCLTVFKPQWGTFYQTLHGLTGGDLFPVILVDGPVN